MCKSMRLILEIDYMGAIPNQKEIDNMEDEDKLNIIRECLFRTRSFDKVVFNKSSFTSSQLDGRIEHMPFPRNNKNTTNF